MIKTTTRRYQFGGSLRRSGDGQEQQPAFSGDTKTNNKILSTPSSLCKLKRNKRLFLLFLFALFSWSYERCAAHAGDVASSERGGEGERALRLLAERIDQMQRGGHLRDAKGLERRRFAGQRGRSRRRTAHDEKTRAHMQHNTARSRVKSNRT
jgi:hypothetical protein